MPQIGEIKRGSEIGKKGHCFIWEACLNCGKERWVQLKNFRTGQPVYLRCQSCGQRISENIKRRENHYRWKGGRIGHGRGYIMVLLQPNDFFYPMANSVGYVLEHRLTVAKKLGRCLQPWEIVHHKGIRYTDIRNRSDNLEDNLELSISTGEHSRGHSKGYHDGYLKGLYDGHEVRIKQLEARVTNITRSRECDP